MSRLRVKFCGIMSVSDGLAAAEAGADAIGMVLYANARRKISPSLAAEIVSALPPYVTPVGLFVNAPSETVISIATEARVRTVQFHGNESPEDVAAVAQLQVIKVLPVNDQIQETLDLWRQARNAGRVPNLAGILLDSAGGGGTGVANDFGRIVRLQNEGLLSGLPPMIVAGGLEPRNVAGVVRLLRPFAVDVSSGIEEEFGRKSIHRMNAFIQNAAEA